VIGNLVSDERGFSLMELLVTLAVGSILLLAIFGALDFSVKADSRVQDRVDSTQRGRAAMELITRQLRSQICLGPGYPAIPSGITSDGNSITFYTDLGGDTPKLQRRTITYSGGTVFETDYNVAGTIPTAPTFTLARQNWVLAERLNLVTSVPFFRYYAFTPNPVTPNQWLNSTSPFTLADADKPRVVKVSISFAADRLGVSRSMNNLALSTFQNDIYVRTSDASDPDHSPQCI
jgi:prepilin-type N-terminal cleavage/methylation domain-containing protein